MPLPSDIHPRDALDFVSAVTDLTPATVNATFPLTRGIYVAAAGNLTATMADGNDATFLNVAAGTLLPIRCTGTKEATTTVTSLLRLY